MRLHWSLSEPQYPGFAPLGGLLLKASWVNGSAIFGWCAVDGRWLVPVDGQWAPMPSTGAAVLMSSVPSALHGALISAMADPARELLLLQVMDS